jgi:hypothetical protein
MKALSYGIMVRRWSPQTASRKEKQNEAIRSSERSKAKNNLASRFGRIDRSWLGGRCKRCLCRAFTLHRLVVRTFGIRIIVLKRWTSRLSWSIEYAASGTDIDITTLHLGIGGFDNLCLDRLVLLFFLDTLELALDLLVLLGKCLDLCIGKQM